MEAVLECWSGEQRCPDGKKSKGLVRERNWSGYCHLEKKQMDSRNIWNHWRKDVENLENVNVKMKRKIPDCIETALAFLEEQRVESGISKENEVLEDLSVMKIIKDGDPGLKTLAEKTCRFSERN